MLHTSKKALPAQDYRVPSAIEIVPKRSQALPGTSSAPHARFSTAALDLLIIASRRCSAFFAEAAVLVLVFGILDYFMMKGRIELGWMAGALAISLVLLAGSVAMDFSAHRWIKAHP